jgi:anti-sigma regulatory factor (Ser/Thr protein kinase)
VSDTTDLPVRAMSESSWTCSRTFPARPDQVGQARVFLSRMLEECRFLDDVVLICSELATNAILHSDSAAHGGSFTVRARVRDCDYVWVEVEDQGGRWSDDGESDDQRGRGLEIVSMLADYWDIRGDDTGRVVCARIDWPGVMRDRA